MDFSTEGILTRMKAGLKNEDTKIEGSFSMDNLQAVAEELARFNAMQIIPLMNTLAEKEDDMGTSGNERHYVRWAKEARDTDGKRIVGNAKVNSIRDGTGLVSIAILTTDAKPPTAEQTALVQNYINRQRPVGAEPVVSAAEGIDIRIEYSIRKLPGYTAESVMQNIKIGLEKYFITVAFQSGFLSLNYFTLGNIVSDTDGVAEINNLLVNGRQESIMADYNKFFILKEVLASVTE